MADDAAARTYLQQANELIANQDYDRAIAKLELADVEMEDLSGDVKTVVAALIQETHAAIATARSSAHRPKYLRMIANYMDEAESDIGNLVTWPGTERKLAELFADEIAKVAIPTELTEALPKFNTFKKLHARKATIELTQQVERDVGNAESEWAETKQLFEDPDGSSYSRGRGVERTNDYIAGARRRLAALPQDNDAVKALTLRIDAMSAEITVIALAGEAAEMVATLRRRFESYENEFGGWEEETGDGPTWDDYRRQNTERNTAFGAPRTLAYRQRTESILTDLESDSNYQAVASADAVRDLVDATRASVETARASLRQRIESLMSDAMEADISNEYDYERLDRGIEDALGEHSLEGQTLRKRVSGKLKGHADALNDAPPPLDVDALSEKATAVYPSLYAGLQWVEEIDLSVVGQQIGFVADNLMGYRFTPDGSFYFATTIGGQPVAGKFDAALKAGIAATEAAIGRALGDDDSDGKWDVVAVVTDKKAKLMARRQAESSGTIGGVNVQMGHEYHEPVEAVVLEILAAKCGPFAGAKGRGVLNPDGTMS
ncbi:MAG: hypothetical protein ABJB74_04130 [Gemmatimonas sp.]